jgi:hypothetical protein
MAPPKQRLSRRANNAIGNAMQLASGSGSLEATKRQSNVIIWLAIQDRDVAKMSTRVGTAMHSRQQQQNSLY